MKQKNYPSHILLIDDDTEDCGLFTEALSGVSPHTSLSCLHEAESLWDAIENNLPALIFIDLKLNGEDGIYWVRELKAHPVYHNIPLIMWSTSVIPGNVAKAYKAGVALYFEKPWKLSALESELKDIFRQNGPDPSVKGARHRSVIIH